MKFIIAGGGTGGHLFPGLAVGEVLLERGHEVIIFISEKDVDALATKLRSVPELSWWREATENTRKCLATKQDWQSVAESTIGLYYKAAEPRRRTFSGHVASSRPQTP